MAKRVNGKKKSVGGRWFFSLFFRSGTYRAGCARHCRGETTILRSSAPRFLGPLLLCLLPLSPSVTHAHSVRELSNKSEVFDQQTVSVIGEVHDVVTRYGEKPYTTFKLHDAQDNVLPVFTWGTPTFKQGQFCRVAGTFFTEKPLGAYVLKHGIEATTVAKVSADEDRMESTIFKKKKRTGIRGSRGFYIPQ